MPKTLTGDHAEDVGGAIVEPGGELPGDSDPDVVARLEDEGRLGDPEGAVAPAKRKRED